MEKNKLYFPLFADLTEKKVLVVGGGNIAARRIHTLAPFCGQIKVVAPRIAKEIEAEDAVCEKRAFRPEDLSGIDLVLAATDSRETDEEIHALCKQMNIPVNVAGSRKLCDFYFPGVIRKDPVVVGITASGRDHKKAKEIRQKIEETCFPLAESEKGKNSL